MLAANLVADPVGLLMVCKVRRAAGFRKESQCGRKSSVLLFG